MCVCEQNDLQALETIVMDMKTMSTEEPKTGTIYYDKQILQCNMKQIRIKICESTVYRHKACILHKWQNQNNTEQVQNLILYCMAGQ